MDPATLIFASIGLAKALVEAYTASRKGPIWIKSIRFVKSKKQEKDE